MISSRLSGLCVLAMCVLLVSGCDIFVDADQRIARAESHIESGDDRTAMIELLNAVKSEPENVRARLLLAEVALRLGDIKAAEREIAAAGSNGAQDAQLAPLRADLLLAKGEFQQLLDDLEAGNLTLAEPARSTKRGLALQGLRQVEAAREAFQQALESDANAARARIGLAEVMFATGERDEALREIDRVLSADPRNALALALKGTVLSRSGEPRAAIDALSAARDNAAGRLTPAQLNIVLVTLVEAQLAVNDVPGAVKTHAALAAGAPDAAMTRLIGARVAMVQENYSQAIAEAQRALVAAPELVQAKLLLGAALLANGDLNQAEARLAELVRDYPSHLEARKLLAQVQLRLDRPARAAEILSAASATGEGSADLALLQGIAALKAGNADAAIALMEQGVAAQPSNNQAKLDLAMAYLNVGENQKARDLLSSMGDTAGGLRRDALLIAAVGAADGTDAAETEIDRMLAARPNDVGTLNVAAAFFAQRGDLARSRQYVDRALKVDPKDLATLRNAARIAAAAGDRDGANAFLERVLTVDPADTSAKLGLAQLALRAGDAATGTRRLEEARKSDPKSVEARLLLAALHLRQGDAQKADTLFQEAVSAAENKAAVTSTIGGLLMQTGRYDEAQRFFQDAVRYDDANAEHHVRLAYAQSALGNDTAARASLNKALAVDPDSFAAAARLALLDAKDGRKGEAMARVDSLKRKSPRSADPLLVEGEILMAARDYRGAAEAYAKAAKLQPSQASAVGEYRARKAARLPDASGPLANWVNSHPEDARARLLLAEAYAGEGRRPLAIAQYEVLASAPEPDATILNNLAWMYFEAGDSRAEDVAKRAYELAPNLAQIADTYAWILVRSGKVAEGLPILERALSQGQGVDAEVRYHYAVALKESGQRDKAREELRALLAGGGSFNSAQEAQRLLTSLGN